MTVTIREFTRNIYKYLKEGVVVVTRNGVEEYVVTITKASNVMTNKDISSHGFIEDRLSLADKPNNTTYESFEDSI